MFLFWKTVFLQLFLELSGIEKICNGRKSWISTFLSVFCYYCCIFVSQGYTQRYFLISSHVEDKSQFLLRQHAHKSCEQKFLTHLSNTIFDTSSSNEHFCWSACWKVLINMNLEGKYHLLEEMLQTEHTFLWIICLDLVFYIEVCGRCCGNVSLNCLSCLLWVLSVLTCNLYNCHFLFLPFPNLSILEWFYLHYPWV